ncbi:hypothetical protein U1Q18_028242 [Sarracenia purpurea var. burkii]
MTQSSLVHLTCRLLYQRWKSFEGQAAKRKKQAEISAAKIAYYGLQERKKLVTSMCASLVLCLLHERCWFNLLIAKFIGNSLPILKLFVNGLLSLKLVIDDLQILVLFIGAFVKEIIRW